MMVILMVMVMAFAVGVARVRGAIRAMGTACVCVFFFARWRARRVVGGGGVARERRGALSIHPRREGAGA